MPGTSLESAVYIAEKIRENVESLHLVHAFSKISNCVTLSLGVATVMPSQETSPQHLIKIADQALYRAKEKGRNQVNSSQNSINL